eukprot:3729774-Lingulodinium_polyedra.AAC.1
MFVPRAPGVVVACAVDLEESRASKRSCVDDLAVRRRGSATEVAGDVRRFLAAKWSFEAAADW